MVVSLVVVRGLRELTEGAAPMCVLRGKEGVDGGGSGLDAHLGAEGSGGGVVGGGQGGERAHRGCGSHVCAQGKRGGEKEGVGLGAHLGAEGHWRR